MSEPSRSLSIPVSFSLSHSDPAPTIAFPLATPRRRDSRVIAHCNVDAPIADEMVLSSRDIVSSAPLSRRAAAARAAAAADPLIGRIVADRYRIIEPLGRGGMGIVYKVEHTRIGKLLAMKLLAGELSHSPEVVRRFKREALTVSKLHSPSTVQVFDFGVADGLTYLVMELVQGQTLGRLLQSEGPMSAHRLAAIVVQVASSLAEAHAMGIVHRDIKPDNLMILSAADGTDLAKVLDFGLAKLREADGLCDVTSHGTILGTPYYMAPEQIRGEGVDPRADVYALGALMYRALTGVHPFAGSPMTVLSRHLSEAPIPPHERAPELGIPLAMSRLVMRALRKRPEDRFQRVEELRALLIEEIRAMGAPGVELLLDSAKLRSLGRRLAPANSVMARGPAPATRDEVDAYERKLRRTRYGFAGATLLAIGAASLLAGRALAQGDEGARGVEREPNDGAAEATPLTLGRAMKGQLGRRIDENQGDRDVYAFDLPATEPGGAAFLSLHLGALPNLPMCAMLYKPGFAEALGQYCPGRAGRDLALPALRLDPGRYLLAVVQDMDSYGSGASFVHENISDWYALRADTTAPAPGVEVEPNDQPATATPLALGRACSATLGWVHDEDVYCLPRAATGRVRWSVRASFRESGVIEVTPMRAGEEGAPVRVHPEPKGRVTEGDALSPWRGPLLDLDGVETRCLRVRLTTDPWSTERGGSSPPGGSEPYVVEAQQIR